MRHRGLCLSALGVAALLAACTTAEQRIQIEALTDTGQPGPVKEERVEESRVAAPAGPPQDVAALQEQPAEAAALPPASTVVEPPSPFMFDILFDFDRFTLRDDGRDRVEVNAGRLKGKDGWRLLLEGRGDERGTVDYNLVLGERRAQTVQRYLKTLGIETGLITTTSYGKVRPLCVQHSEACWALNRSVHFSLTIDDPFYQRIP